MDLTGSSLNDTGRQLPVRFRPYNEHVHYRAVFLFDPFFVPGQNPEPPIFFRLDYELQRSTVWASCGLYLIRFRCIESTVIGIVNLFCQFLELLVAEQRHTVPTVWSTVVVGSTPVDLSSTISVCLISKFQETHALSSLSQPG